jgi:uncharacterized protein (DUF1015 family)
MTTEILPFLGIFYNKNKIKDYGLVLTQPYDKITPEMQNIYYKRYPYNLVRITKGKEFKSDDEHNNKYSRAGEYIEEWLKNKIIVQDTKRAIYAYHQEYHPPIKGVACNKLQIRKGFIALMRLKDFGRGVHPHERTLLKPKQDRLSQMRATGGSTGQIFMLYSDPKLIINSALNKITACKKPDVELKDDYGVINKLWKITDPQVIKIIQTTMKNKDVFIADGHHRYETALNYRDEMRALGLKCIGNESYENRMMTFINMDDKGLTVLPTHRLIFGLNKFSVNTFMNKLKQYFWFNEYPCRSSKEDKFARIDLMEDLVMTGQTGRAFGLVVKGVKKYYMLTIKDDKMMEKIIAEKHSSTWKRLDVTILHSLVLEKILGITKEQVANEQKVNYIRSADEAIEKVKTGKYQMAFILNPTKIEEVKKVSIHNERMPQKSTDFYPKLLSGIVISRVNYNINKIKNKSKERRGLCTKSYLSLVR